MRLSAGIVVAVVAAGCGDKVIDMSLQLPDDRDRWDTSCVLTIEVFTEGLNYPDQSDDYIGQTLDTSDKPPKTYDDVLRAVAGRFDVQIPDTGLSGVEMYGWAGASGFFSESTFPDLVFYSRVLYDGQDTVTIPLVPNMDCRTSNVTVRPIDLIRLVTTHDCTQAAISNDELGYTSLGTLSPGLYKDYLFGWGGQHGAAVANGVAVFSSPTTVGPASCLAVYGGTNTATTGGCVTATKACAMGAEVEAVLVDDGYAQNSLDPTIQEDLRGGVIGAVLDATHAPIAGARVAIPADGGKLVYVDLDTTTRRLIPTTGSTTTASGMFILYSNDLVDAQVTATVAGAPVTKTVRVGAQRNYNDGTKAPAGVIVTF